MPGLVRPFVPSVHGVTESAPRQHDQQQQKFRASRAPSLFPELRRHRRNGPQRNVHRRRLDPRRLRCTWFLWSDRRQIRDCEGPMASRASYRLPRPNVIHLEALAAMRTIKDHGFGSFLANTIAWRSLNRQPITVNMAQNAAYIPPRIVPVVFVGAGAAVALVD
jgi:hypothetical protein